MCLTLARYLQVANISLSRPPQPDHRLFFPYRCRCLHLCRRARQLHHQDWNRSRSLGSRCLRPRRTPESAWWSRDSERTRITWYANTVGLLARLRQSHPQQPRSQVPSQRLREFNPEELGKPRRSSQGWKLEAAMEDEEWCHT